MELLETTTVSSDGSRPGAVKSVEQVCRKVEVESARIAFNTLNSINNKKRDEANTTTLADLLLDEIVKQSKCTDAQQVLEYQTRISRIGHCLLDSCDLMDRQKCIEICAVFFERNKAHLKYISDITSSIVLNRVNAFPWQSSSSATSVIQQTVLLPPDAIRFRNAMKSIPSLSNLHSLIDEFCILFWNDDELESLEECFDDGIQRVDNFNTKGNHHHQCQETTLIYLTQLHHTFDSTITGTRDLEKWLTAFEIAKISNRARVVKLEDFDLCCFFFFLFLSFFL
ncbi:hypothetical protein BDR26DRAFT_852349 [Obelidium mucronatum]|nr:hypothetical protein BDR26DRAFT_852349 [Obelidium mucronatum]